MLKFFFSCISQFALQYCTTYIKMINVFWLYGLLEILPSVNFTGLDWRHYWPKSGFFLGINQLLTLNGPGFLVDPEAGGGLNQDALVFDVLYCYLSLKTCIQSLKLKFESSVVCRINDQHPSLSSFSVRPCRIYVLR